ncbi:unnamed protein product, partial [Bubo scandiacus]
ARRRGTEWPSKEGSWSHYKCREKAGRNCTTTHVHLMSSGWCWLRIPKGAGVCAGPCSEGQPWAPLAAPTP